MGVKHIHVVLIVASIILFIFSGLWALNHSYTGAGYFSFLIAGALIIYCIQFLKKIKAL